MIINYKDMTTPIQIAIKRIKAKKWDDIRMDRSDTHDDALDAAIEILTDLLPDEEKFAEDIWDQARYSRSVHDGPTFIEYYSQFKPEDNSLKQYSRQ